MCEKERERASVSERIRGSIVDREFGDIIRAV